MLIKALKNNEKMSSIEISIGVDTLKEMALYLKKTGVETYDYFIEEGCQMIFEMDKDWIEYKKKQK